MIKSFSFSNFRSFKDEVTVDFSTVDENRNWKVLTTGEYNKVVAIYGPPASGKSTILDALHGRYDETNFKADADGEMKTFHLDDLSVEQATQIYIDNPKILKYTVGVLKCSDLGISDVFVYQDGRVVFEHGGKFELPISSESSGTLRLYCMLIGIYRAIKSKGIALWEERGALHHMLVRHIILSFYETDAQLIMTTNISLEYMMEDEYFNRSQVYIVERSGDGSALKRLDEFDKEKEPEVSLSNNLFINML